LIPKFEFIFWKLCNCHQYFHEKLKQETFKLWPTVQTMKMDDNMVNGGSVIWSMFSYSPYYLPKSSQDDQLETVYWTTLRDIHYTGTETLDLLSSRFNQNISKHSRRRKEISIGGWGEYYTRKRWKSSSFFLYLLRK